MRSTKRAWGEQRRTSPRARWPSWRQRYVSGPAFGIRQLSIFMSTSTGHPDPPTASEPRVDFCHRWRARKYLPTVSKWVYHL